MYTSVHTHRLSLYHLQRWVLTSHVHECTHLCTHTHTDWACTPFGFLFITLYSQSMYMSKNILALLCKYHICHKHRACTTCSDFGFLFLTLLLQSLDSHECTHLQIHCYVTSMCTIVVTHTHTPTHPHTHTHKQALAVTLGFYFSHCYHKAYMCMNVHTCATL